MPNELPLFNSPATNFDPTSTTTATNKRPRFSPPSISSGLAVKFAAFKRRCGNGSLPEDSIGDPTITESDAGSYKARRSFNEKSRRGSKEEDEGGEVDEIVVENLQAPQYWMKSLAASGGTDKVGGGGNGSAGSPVTGPIRTNGASEPGSATSQKNTNFEQRNAFMQTASFLRWRIWPQVVYFFHPKYQEVEQEEAYQKELWYTSKSVTIFGACFLVFNWVLAIALLPHPWSIWNDIQNYGLGPALSLILVPLAALDVPRSKRYWLVWQILVFCSIWITASGNIIDMYLCGYYTPERDCGNRDFISLLYSVTALPVVGLFALGQTRVFTLFGVVVWTSLVAGLILADHVAFIRNMLNLILFQGFILFAHYRRELAERRMYTLRAELKVQFRAKQKAQISERKTMDSKRRFSSYIFHEVRVPLNTALLAVQNIEGANGFSDGSELGVEYTALQGSLSMMSQVLNDVLDFSRMEKGGFSSVSRPFSFHKVMRSIFGPLKLDATARRLDLSTNLDLRIDEVAKKAAYEDCSGEVEEGEGLVMGDEMRLRQVINNLTSNACKFTSSGGKVTINTMLVYPSTSTPTSGNEVSYLSASGSGESNATTANDPITPPVVTITEDGATSTTYGPRLSTTNILQHEAKTAEEESDHQVIIVRIEICDTGVGIRPVDMAQNRLFSPYIQTEIGRVQAGKGTGLGLSIVRQIVSLSGGRLGVQSQVGVGSKFWVEMPFTVGTITRQTDLEPHRRVNLTLEKILSTPDSYSDTDFKFIPTSVVGHSEGILRQIEEVESSSAPHLRMTSNPTIEEREVLTLQPIPIPSSLPPPFLRPENRSNTSTSSVGLLGSPSSSTSSTAASRTLVFEKGPLNVLVVDDDSLTRRLMSRLLSRLGCNVSSAENGAIALDMLLGKDETPALTSEFDITFLDNQMPMCSGLQVVSRLRQLGRDDLVIGVTANALLSDQEEYLTRGASWVLTKPVSEADLKRFLVFADRKRMGFTLPTDLS